MLVLDEPTNDLDIQTLELLEELLADRHGAVQPRSRVPRRVVTSVIAAEGDGKWREYVGGFSDWRIQSARADQLAQQEASVRSGSRAVKEKRRKRRELLQHPR